MKQLSKSDQIKAKKSLEKDFAHKTFKRTQKEELKFYVERKFPEKPANSKREGEIALIIKADKDFELNFSRFKLSKSKNKRGPF